MLVPLRRPSAWRDAAPWLVLSLVVWAVGLVVQRQRAPEPIVELAGWQRSFRELPFLEQRTFRHLREATFEVEHARVETGRWPEPAALAEAGVEPFRGDELSPARSWVKRQHGVYTSYVGLPGPGARAQRWLVLFIEPTTNEPAPLEDEEHHTRADGVPLHVTVWSQPDDAEPVPDEVLAFPAASGWVQRVGR
ncbi:MAG: hypothetical protein JNJ54_15875 [Myxococcaceae bacterium]|nr:hypothetical protein [Myxococcaceae bacterium]